MTFFQIFLILVAVAAVWDFMTYKIPNALVIGIIGLFFVENYLSSTGFIYAPYQTFVLAILVGFLLYLFRVIGAGDAKLLAACSLWAADHSLMIFLAATIISGGIISLAYLRFSKAINTLRPAGANTVEYQGHLAVPYAIPIFIGCLSMALVM
ncbi:MAG: A24 family peptidase [Alphaproteobacteria bacterium]